MLHMAEYGAHLLSSIAIAADKLSLGLLMDPAELGRTVPANHKATASGRWWLCGNMHPRMFRAAQTLPIRHLGKVIVTGQGTRYLVLAQQAGAWQHRFLLQVAGRQVLKFLAVSVEAGFDLSLGLAGSDESLLVQDCRFVQSLVGGIDARVEEAVKNMSPHTLREEACVLATRLLSPAEVESEITGMSAPYPERAAIWIQVVRDQLAAKDPVEEMLARCLSTPSWGSWPPDWWPEEAGSVSRD